MNDVVIESLEEALISRYEEAKNKRGADNDQELMDKAISDMQEYYKTCCNYSSKIAELEMSRDHDEKTFELERKKMKQRSDDEQRHDESTISLEKEKRKMSWQKVALDVGLALVPVLTLLISISANSDLADRIFYFEEKGRTFTSKNGRDLHIRTFNK